jgi:metal-responsive CopG/Arc/MetJ family transcriptional regulator
MSKRINVILPDATVAVLDRIASKGSRSRLISQAVLHYVKTQSTAKSQRTSQAGSFGQCQAEFGHC